MTESAISKEINRVKAGITLPKPIFDVEVSANRINVTPLGELTCDVESLLKRHVLNSYEARWSRPDNAFKLVQHSWRSSDPRNSIISELADTCRICTDSKNPRLTKLFQWYKRVLAPAHLKSNQDLDDMVFEVWKYFASINVTQSEAHRQNALALLEMIKQKFESRGITQ